MDYLRTLKEFSKTLCKHDSKNFCEEFLTEFPKDFSQELPNKYFNEYFKELLKECPMDSLSKFLRGIPQGTIYRNSTTAVYKHICEDIFNDFPQELPMELPKGYSKEFFKDCCRESSETFLALDVSK